MFWKGGILALSIDDFSACIIDIANKLSAKRESTTTSLKIVKYDKVIFKEIKLKVFFNKYKRESFYMIECMGF